MGAGNGSGGACCARSPKAFSCFRGRDGEGEGNIVEYAPYARNSAFEFVVDESINRNRSGWLPAGPTERTVPTFAIGQDAMSGADLQGEPLYTGDILRLSLGDAIHECIMTLYVNGFLIQPRNETMFAISQPTARLWSPFSLIEKCQVKSKQSESQWAIFKLTFFRKEGQDTSFYFATAGATAEAQRDKWVDEIIRVMSNMTLSLFPQFELSVDPVPGRVATSTRIMAGYLLQGGPLDSASLVFCELHAYVGRESRLALYRDEWCEHEVMNIPLVDSSIVSTRKGEYCTVFGINDNLFCARTEDERELWLRAVSNIKVKLMFEAPDPTAEELEIFRSAVHERIETLPPPLPPGGQESLDAFRAAAKSRAMTDATAGWRDAIFVEVPRRPPAGPKGDTQTPYPTFEEEELGITSLDDEPCAALCVAVPQERAAALELSPQPRAHASSGDQEEEVPEAMPDTPAPPTATAAAIAVAAAASAAAAAAAVDAAGGSDVASTSAPEPIAEAAAPAPPSPPARRPALQAAPVSMAAAVLTLDAVACGEIEGL